MAIAASNARTNGLSPRWGWARMISIAAAGNTGGTELLTLACQGLDRAEALREEIDRDGAVIRVRGTIKDHPGLSHEPWPGWG
jgi:hypothetical protein